ncbi:MAG: TetR family transcriptional regulator [Mucilaginibacter sp.]|nr:TetR family transcriptional regulator [Mucilaginibacter sp.]
MKKNHGEIIEYVVRKHGYNISDLAKELNVNRRSIYNYFGSRNLKPYVIFQIGKVVRHDFSKEFPELFSTADFQNLWGNEPRYPIEQTDSAENAIYKGKYLDLLEKYNELLVETVA